MLAAVGLTTIELVRFSRLQSNFPSAMVIAGVPVGGLNRQEAAERLLEVYSLPVELQYNENIIHLDPNLVGFEINLESMLAAADLQRTQGPFWGDFWDFLWGRQPGASSVPLDFDKSDSRLEAYLQTEIIARYDQPAIPAQPIPGTVNFNPGSPGTSLDMQAAIRLINNAMRSPTNRTVELPTQRTNPGRPSFENLRVLIQQTIDLSNFDGLTGMYLLDLQTAQEFHFLYQDGEELDPMPDLSFTASSTIKIPIMVSIFRRIDEEPPAEIMLWMEEMITKSGNDPADWLMQSVIDPTLGPLAVTEDMQALGFDSTFLAGHFYDLAPLLIRFETPGNSRSDQINEADPYSQTTPTEIGMLLSDIYQCAETGGSTLLAVFPDEITQDECRQMIDILSRNFIGVLIEAGLPEGTRVAHKHGWVTDIYGVIHDISDVAIIFTPGGNYILTIFLYHPVQAVWDQASTLVAEISRAVYNYYNLPTP